MVKMDKQEYIKSLKNVRIVLGNGFDLHCGLHTKYSDYYCLNFKRYFFIKNKFKAYESTDVFDLNFKDKEVQIINTWDVFFILNGPDSPKDLRKNWCDVESLILSSLIDNETKANDIKSAVLRLGSVINWNVIETFLTSGQTAQTHMDRSVIEFIKQRSKFLKTDYRKFFQFLLAELKQFEKDFGMFIYKQFHDNYLETCSHNNKQFLNTYYLQDAVYTIDELCDENNLSSIDSFNYSSIEKESLKTKFQNINGSYKNPIFGIDSKFPPEDNRYIFTKTARRIDSDMFDESFESKPNFDNVIIYGHSLNEADYSYFFPLFDKLNLLDSTALGVIVFAYSVYDKSSAEYIESDFRKSISKILFEYANSKQLPEPGRLLDSLSTQKRIVTFKLNDIRFDGAVKSQLDREWDKIYKDLDKYIEEVNKGI